MKDTPVQSEEIVIDATTLATIVAILVGFIMVSISIFWGLQVAAKKISTLATPPSPTVAEEAPKEPVIATVSIDNDPKMGSDKAKVVIVEFSDYECPFCKRHATETGPQIKKNFIDKGKVMWVYRDLPLSFHEPVASKEAMYANCAKDQGGDEKYFEAHDYIFANTGSNGSGLSKSLEDMAKDLKLDAQKFKDCVENKKFEQEIRKDSNDAQKAGINGTPGFVIGTMDKDGNVTGKVISGAQPYSVFEETINEYLKK